MIPIEPHTAEVDLGRTAVYAMGWPKSGCTWLTRLLGDALNCPTGAVLPRLDHREIATEGWDRPEPYVVRKGHLIITEGAKGPQHEAWINAAEDTRFIHIVRDPRDVAVSSAHYFKISLLVALQKLHEGWNSNRGPYLDYVIGWLDCERVHVQTSYEALLGDGAAEVVRILAGAELPVDEGRIAAAVERQSFANRVEHIHRFGHDYFRGMTFNLRFMRKGVVGDWKNHFGPIECQKAEEYFGPLLRRLGYEDTVGR